MPGGAGKDNQPPRQYSPDQFGRGRMTLFRVRCRSARRRRRTPAPTEPSRRAFRPLDSILSFPFPPPETPAACKLAGVSFCACGTAAPGCSASHLKINAEHSEGAENADESKLKNSVLCVLGDLCVLCVKSCLRRISCAALIMKSPEWAFHAFPPYSRIVTFECGGACSPSPPGLSAIRNSFHNSPMSASRIRTQPSDSCLAIESGSLVEWMP